MFVFYCIPGAGGRILLWTERSLIDGSVRTLKEVLPSPLVQVSTVVVYTYYDEIVSKLQQMSSEVYQRRVYRDVRW